MKNQLVKCFENVKEIAPLVQNITNYVTVNDCANISIAIGASPIMADAIEEASDIQSISSGLNINIGTLNSNTVKSMIASGKMANKLGHPVLLDAVGSGASPFRDDTVKLLLENIHFSIIKGNISEIKALSNKSALTKGVDANIADKVSDDNIEEVIAMAKDIAKKTSSVIMITGEIDLVVSFNKAFVIKNGCEMMGNITGSGCMLSSLCAAFISANTDNILESAASSVITMGIAGEKAYEKMLKSDSGNSSFRNYLIDEIFKFDISDFDRSAKYELL